MVGADADPGTDRVGDAAGDQLQQRGRERHQGTVSGVEDRSGAARSGARRSPHPSPCPSCSASRRCRRDDHPARRTHRGPGPCRRGGHLLADRLHRGAVAARARRRRAGRWDAGGAVPGRRRRAARGRQHRPVHRRRGRLPWPGRDRDGEPTVASPLHKQVFALRDGRCLDDPAVRLPAFTVRAVGGSVQVGLR